MLTLTAKSEDETAKIGATLADTLGAGDVLLLSGELGAGKTTLARALIRRRAGAPIDVPSPTFALVEPYAFDVPLVHVDLYRLEGPEQIVELGLDDALEVGITIVEWPERASSFFTGPRLDIAIGHRRGEGRVITLTPHGESWLRRIEALASGPLAL
ncbi:MAG: tRNA (adenosine(37)-N6)-threonylcarbamoyltransferase complex ATPase subunit type 1 TsaE [Pseudomonadota bacterium]